VLHRDTLKTGFSKAISTPEPGRLLSPNRIFNSTKESVSRGLIGRTTFPGIAKCLFMGKRIDIDVSLTIHFMDHHTELRDSIIFQETG
jgi:hypothetical protein